MIELGPGELFILPLDSDELHYLDARHLASIDHEGGVSVLESIGTVLSTELIYGNEDYS
jgi:hypothetical protein